MNYGPVCFHALQTLRTCYGPERNILRLIKEKHKTSYIVVQKLSVYEDSVSIGFKCTKYILFHVMR